MCVFRTQRRTIPVPDHRQGRDPQRGGGVDPVHTATARKQGRLAGSPSFLKLTDASSTSLNLLPTMVAGRCSTNGLHGGLGLANGVRVLTAGVVPSRAVAQFARQWPVGTVCFV